MARNGPCEPRDRPFHGNSDRNRPRQLLQAGSPSRVRNVRPVPDSCRRRPFVDAVVDGCAVPSASEDGGAFQQVVDAAVRPVVSGSGGCRSAD